MAAIDLLVLQGFITATREAMEMMASLEIEVVGIQPIADAPTSLGVMASMRLSGKSPGRVAVGFDEKTAKCIVASMLETDPESISREDMLDGASELANLVAGGARAHLDQHETNFELSIPDVSSPAQSTFATDDPDSASIRMRVVGGDVWLLLSMNDPR